MSLAKFKIMHDKTLNVSRKERNIINPTYDKYIGNTMNEEILKAFPLKLGMQSACLSPPHS